MSWKPAYLIHGDDHGRIAERRATLRSKAESEAGAGGVEVIEGDAATPQSVALALSAMTFAMGRRFIVVDGVERWKDADVKAVLSGALTTIAPDTTVAFFAREDGRLKAPPSLSTAVVKVGGSVAQETALKSKDLPRWIQGEATRMGVRMDLEAARRIVDVVGDRQQRLLREVEKLALEHGAGATLSSDDVDDVAAHSSERAVWSLGDALVARDVRGAISTYLQLRDQGEPLARLLPLLSRRMIELEATAARLDAGESPAAIKESAKGAPWMIDKRIREARGADLDAVRAAVETLAALERSSRGMDEVSEDTAAIRALGRIAA